MQRFLEAACAVFLAACTSGSTGYGSPPAMRDASEGDPDASLDDATTDDGDDASPDEVASDAQQGHFAYVRSLQLPGFGTNLAWSPDGTQLVVGGHLADPTTHLRYDIKIFDVASGALKKSFDCHTYWVNASAWTHNPFLGDVIASGAFDHAVKLWAADGVTSPKCDAPTFVTTTQGGPGLEFLGGIDGATASLAFSPDGRYLADANRDGTVRVWQLAPGPDQFKVVALFWDGNGAGAFLSVAWSADSKSLVTGDNLQHRVASWTLAPLWDSATIQSYAAVSWSEELSWLSQNVGAVARSPTWSDVRADAVWNVRVSPDGTQVAAAGSDGLLKVYDARSGAVDWQWKASSSELYGLDWSGRYIAVGAKDAKVYVLDAATKSLHDTLAGHATGVTAVAFSPSSNSLASVAGGALFDPTTHALSVGPDATARIWELQ